MWGRGDHRGPRRGRRPLPDVDRPRRLRRDEPRPRLLGRLRHATRRRRVVRLRVRVHHRAGQRRRRQRRRRAPAVRRRPGRRRADRRPRAAQPHPDRRLAVAVARAGEGRHAHGDRRGRQRRVGPRRTTRRTAAVAVPRRPVPRAAGVAGRLPLPDRRTHAGRGARAAARQARGHRAAHRTAARRGLPGLHHVARLARLQRRQARPPHRGGGGRRLHPDQAQGGTVADRRRAAHGHRPVGRRRWRGDRHRRQPTLGRRHGHRMGARPRAVRAGVDRGADEPRRHPRPSGDPSRQLGAGGHRRARAEPRDLQAAAAGGGGRRRADRRQPGRRCQREPRHPPAGGEVRHPRVPPRRRGRAVRARAAPGDVRLPRRVGHARRPHLRVRRPPARALRRSRSRARRPLPRADRPRLLGPHAGRLDRALPLSRRRRVAGQTGRAVDEDFEGRSSRAIVTGGGSGIGLASSGGSDAARRVGWRCSTSSRAAPATPTSA